MGFKHTSLFLCICLVFLSTPQKGKCAPPTCYSRLLSLSKEIMELLEKVHKSPRTKECAEFLPNLFPDVHNSCMTVKLRDFLYTLENIPVYECKDRPRLIILKRKILAMLTIIGRICYRDLVYLSDDCEAIETGISNPRYSHDTLQLLEETS